MSAAIGGIGAVANGVGTIGHMAGIGRVLALRARILEQNEVLGRTVGAIGTPVAAGRTGAAENAGNGFGAAMESALRAVNDLQSESSAAAAAWERGETQDIASVMMARQKASISFEATLQARNRLLSAYRDIMNMPV